MTRAKSLLIALSIAIPCLAYTLPCSGHNGRDEGAPDATRDTADEGYKAGDLFSCIEVSKDPRTGVRTYTQTCDIPHDPGRPGVAAASEPMAHGVDFWVDQSFANHGGGDAPVPPAYADSGYSDGGYSEGYVSDGYYGYGGGYLPLGDYGGGGGRPGRGHGGHGDHGGHDGDGGHGGHGGDGNHGGGGVGIPVRPGGGGNGPAFTGGYHLPPRSRLSVPPPPRGVGSPPPYYDPGVGAPPPELRYNTRGGRRG